MAAAVVLLVLAIPQTRALSACCDGNVVSSTFKCCTAGEKAAARSARDSCLAQALTDYEAAMAINDTALNDSNQEAEQDREDIQTAIDNWLDSQISICNNYYASQDEPWRTAGNTTCQTAANAGAGYASEVVWHAYLAQIVVNLVVWGSAREIFLADKSQSEAMCRLTFNYACDNWWISFWW